MRPKSKKNDVALSIDQALANTHLKDKVKQLEREKKELIKRHRTDQNYLSQVQAVKGVKPIAIKKRSKSSKHSEATAFLLASDWHAEEIISPKSVNNLNKFNPEIAEARINRFFQNGARLVQLLRKDVEINHVVLALLGDFFSGHIHEELMENTAMGPVEACIWVQGLIAGGIKYLLNELDGVSLTIPCHSGNHARITKKNRHAKEHAHSLEFFMYHNLAKFFENDERVTFQISDSYHSYLDIYGYTVRFHHGHHIRYYGGVGGIYIPVNKAIAQWNKARKASVDCFGHFHQQVDGGHFMCNGSLAGYNAYALSIKGTFEPPRQTFFLLDSRRGRTFVAPIILEEV